MNKNNLYSRLYPVSLRDFDRMADAYCCGEVKFQHGLDTDPCGPVCVFCEDTCEGCGESVF